MQEIKNFIEDKNIFNDIKNALTSPDFPWYYSDRVASIEDTKDFYFSHHFYRNEKQVSSWSNRIMSPILGRLNYNYLLRSRANLYTKHEKHIISDFHVDSSEPHKVALFYVNTCNGYTLFKKGDKILSEENKIVIFDGTEEHASVPQTDTKQRITININFSP